MIHNFFAGAPDARDPAIWDNREYGSVVSTSGEEVSGERALGLSAYWCAIRSISEDVGRLPLLTYKKNKGKRGKELAEDHPAFDILALNPNDEMTSMGLRETVTAHALGWGGGLVEIHRTIFGDIEGLTPIHPIQVVDIKKRGARTWFEITDDPIDHISNKKTKTRHLSSENALFIRGLGPIGGRGYSVFRVAAESIGVGIAAERFGASFFGNGANISGVLKLDKMVSPEAMDKIGDQFQSKQGGGGNSLKPAVLPRGMDWQRVGIPPNEAQFLETRSFSVVEMARWFRISPVKLQHLVDANHKSTEALSIQYVQDTLTPWMVRWEQEVLKKVFTVKERRKYVVKHDFQDLLRGDHEARADFYSALFDRGCLSQNDILDMEDKNPVENGDERYVAMNMQRLSDASNGIAPPKAEGSSSAPLPGDTPKGPSGRPGANFDPATQLMATSLIQRLINREYNAVKAQLGKDFDGFYSWYSNWSKKTRLEMAEALTVCGGAVAAAYNLDISSGEMKRVVSDIANDDQLQSLSVYAEAAESKDVTMAIAFAENQRDNRADAVAGALVERVKAHIKES